ncbi:MAG: ribbon-helix-helix domain-containing protein [Methanimicrococcus sp.]|jgi:RHH-type rel operon transcriptional repressor/antitoxin RelB|nr:ribbon-helix-helix domain-containing protein [Methanimicrococcus sp.]
MPRAREINDAVMLGVRIPAELNARLDILSKETGRNKSFYVREALSEYIADMEDIYLAEKRLEDLRAGRSSTMTLEEVEKAFGLAD